MMRIKNRMIVRVFLGFGCVALVFGLIVQLILPFFFPDEFRNGLTLHLNDPHTFHQIAVQLAEKLQRHGWDAFEFTPHGQFPSGILGALYYIVGINSPVVQLPINALFVGLTAYLIWKTLDFFNIPSKIKIIFISLSLFTPTAMSWNTQIFKDIYIVFAVVAMLYGLMGCLTQKHWKYPVWFIFGSWVIFFVKDYWAEIFLVGFLTSIPFMLFFKVHKNKYFIALLIVSIFSFGIQVKAGRQYYVVKKTKVRVKQKKVKNPITQKWERPPHKYAYPKRVLKIGSFVYHSEIRLIDRYLKRLGVAHNKFLTKYAHGKENYLPELRLNSTSKVLKFIPHALKLGFLEPLPWRSRWEDGRVKGLLFLALRLEMLVFYFCVGLLLYSLPKISRRSTLLLISWGITSFIFIFTLSYAVPNIGTLNRYRFPFVLTLKILFLGIYWNTRRLPPVTDQLPSEQS